jgi:phosphate:Na+ symporter
MPGVLAAAQPNFLAIAAGLCGGLALFLFGMNQMTVALKQVAGGGMRTLLGRLTKNRFLGAVTGATVTAICQSSSVTTVLVVGFITAGLMTLQQAIGVIMGANIGSTVTAQLIAFQVTALALPMVSVGFAMNVLSKTERVQQAGNMIMGMGLVFFGMSLMSDATFPLRDYPPFIDLMRKMDNVVLAIVASAVITGIIQSSAATTGIVIVLAGQGYISLEAGIALAMGANVGTCATAILAAIGRPAAARQAAAVHVLFNVLGVVIWATFLPQLADFVRWLSPAYPELHGVARLAAEMPRQIANAHTTFNVANTLLFIGFTGLFAKLVQRLIPQGPEPTPLRVEPKYLGKAYLQTPALALDRMRMELGHMGEQVLGMLAATPAALVTGTRQELQLVRDMDNNVDTLYAAIVDYTRRLASQELSDAEVQRLNDWLVIAEKLEGAGDLIETNLVVQGRHRLDQRLTFSGQTIEVLKPLFEAVRGAMRDALQAVATGDEELAEAVVKRKALVNRLADDAGKHLATRLLSDAPNRVDVFRVETDIISQYQRLYYFAKRIAKVIAEDLPRIESSPRSDD